MTRPAATPRAAIVKHSLAIAGHRTSISLEAAFWQRLQAIAAERALPIAALVAGIDARRGPANLSSAIRVFVLEDALGRLSGAQSPGAGAPGAAAVGGGAPGEGLL